MRCLLFCLIHFKLICSFACLFISMCMRVGCVCCVQMCMCGWVSMRAHLGAYMWRPQVPCSITLYRIPSRQGLSSNLDLGWRPETWMIPLSLTHTALGGRQMLMLGFFWGFRNPTSGSHACTTSALIYRSSIIIIDLIIPAETWWGIACLFGDRVSCCPV